MLQLLNLGFPVYFNGNSPLYSNKQSHYSAVEHPENVMVYLKEEKLYKAVLGPFKCCPIENAHSSPFLTCEKSNAPNRHAIIDLS